jgi:hypothetical protein
VTASHARPEWDTVASMMGAFAKLASGIQTGATWELMGQAEAAKTLLEEVFDERIHRNDRNTYQLRANLQKKPDVASYAGFIVDQGNPTSGPYARCTHGSFRPPTRPPSHRCCANGGS